MDLLELLKKPVWQMTGEELLFIQKNGIDTTEHKNSPNTITETNRRYVYGYAGIAQLFNCSIPTAARIKNSGRINNAITQIGRKIIVDAELALQLANKKTGGR